MGDITGVIDAALARIDQRERQLQALVGEEDRRGRLVREGRELAAARTEPRLRPVVVMRMTTVSNGIDTGMWTQFAK